MSAHTPESCYRKYQYEINEGWIIRVEEFDTPVALVYNKALGSQDRVRLIQHAPEMFELLKDIKSQVIEWSPLYSVDKNFVKLDNLIKKIEGDK